MSISVGEALGSFRSQMLIGVTLLAGIVAGYLIDVTFFNDLTPVQPIEFSHRIHATDNSIPCLHCHVYADRTPSAGVPSVNKCMGCHQSVATDRPEIQKVAGYWERQEPIPWVKIHDVPDFVHFTHKRHIKAGLTCQECHGPIETMDRITRQAPMTMPWCVDCHTERGNENGRDCWTCHK